MVQAIDAAEFRCYFAGASGRVAPAAHRDAGGGGTRNEYQRCEHTVLRFAGF
jgi:hypothetical protein